MKLGLDVSAVPNRPAGAGRYIMELAKRVPLVGPEVTLLTRHSDTARWLRMNSARLVVADIPDSRPARLIYERFLLGRSETVRSLDVLHSPHYTMPHGSKTPVVVTIHDMTYFTNPQWHEKSKVQLFKRSIAYASTHAAAIVAVSDYTARQLHEFAPARCPVVVAPHGVDLQRFNPTSNHAFDVSSLSGSSAPYVFFVGTLEPRKGVDVLLRAFDEVADSDPDIELWIAGQKGWGDSKITDELQSLRHAQRVRMLGYVSDDALEDLFRQARVVAYPSRGEGFGLPVIEALACGAVVITTRNTVMAELVGDAATTVDIGDAAQLASAIIRLHTAGDAERTEIQRLGRLHAERYTWEACIARHLRAYEIAATS